MIDKGICRESPVSWLAGRRDSGRDTPEMADQQTDTAIARRILHDHGIRVPAAASALEPKATGAPQLVNVRLSGSEGSHRRPDKRWSGDDAHDPGRTGAQVPGRRLVDHRHDGGHAGARPGRGPGHPVPGALRGARVVRDVRRRRAHGQEAGRGIARPRRPARRRGRVPAPELDGGGRGLLGVRAAWHRNRADRPLLRPQGSRLHPHRRQARGVRHRGEVRPARIPAGPDSGRAHRRRGGRRTSTASSPTPRCPASSPPTRRNPR